MFVALAGSDCRELWTLLVQFFGKGTGFDPFDFLDEAPAIKALLDLKDTDSDDDAASSVTIGSVSTTASTASTANISAADAAQASTSGAPTTSTCPKLKPKVTLPDQVPSVDDAEGFIPTSFADLHSTGLPHDVKMQQSDKTTAKGSSLYICPHQDCGSTPYVGDLYGCSSHLCRVHYGTCLMCPYCPSQKYYRVSGWKRHMVGKHPTAPWYGASEPTQATLMLKSLQEEISAPTSSTEKVDFKLPSQEEISTVPLKPAVVEEPPEESLPYTADDEEGDETAGTFDIAPEEEQQLLEAEEEADDPLDTQKYEYFCDSTGEIVGRYRKSTDPSAELTISIVQPDPPSSSGDPSGPPPPKKPKADK